MSDLHPVQQVLNKALDREREARGLRSDAALAQEYHINPKTISFLRTGRWSRVDSLLISALARLATPPAADLAEPADATRRAA